MAQGEMFGAPAGISQGIRDSDSSALHAFQMMDLLGKAQMRPTERAAKEAGTRKTLAEAGKLETEMQQNQAFMQALARGQQGDPGAPGDIASELENMGRIALKTGNVTKGRELINTGSNVRARLQTNIFRAAQAARLDAQTAEAQAKAIAGVAGAVRDETSYQHGLMSLASQGIDISEFPPSYVEGAEQMRLFAEASVTEATRRRLKIQEADSQARTVAEKNREADRAARRPLIRAQTEAADALAERRKREGGTGVGVGSAPPGDRMSAALIIKEAGFELEDAELRLASNDIANRARVLMRANRGLDMPTAMRQAFSEAQTAGDFQAAEGWKSLLPNGKNKKYLGGGKTAGTPMPLPIKDGKIEAATTVVGKFYYTPDGKVWERTGTGMKLAPGAKAPGALGTGSARPGAADAEDDDDDD